MYICTGEFTLTSILSRHCTAATVNSWNTRLHQVWLHCGETYLGTTVPQCLMFSLCRSWQTKQVFRVKKLVGRQWGAPNSNYLLVIVPTFVMPYSITLNPRITPGCITQRFARMHQGLLVGNCMRSCIN